MKVKLNDKVLVIAGKDRGKTGKVIRLQNAADKIVVEKVNIRIKHIKKSQTKPGSKVEFEAAFPVSNVKVICPNCKKAGRVGYTKLENGKKQRVCKKCNEALDKVGSKK